jgi:hypothetical protein
MRFHLIHACTWIGNHDAPSIAWAEGSFRAAQSQPGRLTESSLERSVWQLVDEPFKVLHETEQYHVV